VNLRLERQLCGVHYQPVTVHWRYTLCPKKWDSRNLEYLVHLLNAYIICHRTLVMLQHYLILHKNGRVMSSFPQWCEWLWKEPVSVCLKWFWASCSAGVRSDVPLLWFKVTSQQMHAAMFATGFVDNAMRTTVTSVNEPLLQLVNVMFRFCVVSGSVETYLRWGGKLCTRLIAKVVRISHAKFHCNRLTTVQDLQDYASLIFFRTHCM